MALDLYTKRVYGVLRYYPDCPISKAIATIKGAPTLTSGDVDTLRAAGVGFNVHEEDGKITKLGVISS